MSKHQQFKKTEHFQKILISTMKHQAKNKLLKSNIGLNFLHVVSNWIFVINDSSDTFQKRINEKIWPIFENTPNKRKLKIGDMVIFYQAGINGKKFIGSASIASRITKRVADHLNLTDTEIWSNHVPIEAVKEHLDFVKNKKYWGMYFQGGVKAISDNDYKLIIADAGRISNTA